MAEKIQYPELSSVLKQGFNLKLFKYFGAGAIMASVTIGSGETVFASTAGAVFGYTLMWLFLGGAFLKGIQVYTAARYMTLTGEHPMTHWAHFPGPRNWVPAFIGIISLACFPFWLAGLPQLLGETMNWIFGITGEKEELVRYAKLWATGFICLAVFLTWIQPYKWLEIAQTIIVAILLVSVMAACFASSPDWGAVAVGMIPTPVKYPDWLATAAPDFLKSNPTIIALIATSLGAIGGGTYDYLGYIGCFREKNWGLIGQGHQRISDADVEQDGKLPIDTSADNVARGKRWLLAPQFDVWIGFACVIIFTLGFITLGAVVLHPEQKVPQKFGLLSEQATFLTQFHPSLKYLYQLGIFMAIWGTVYGAYEVYIRTAYECLAPLSAKVRHMSNNKFRNIILVYCGTGALALLWGMGDDPTKIVAPAAIVGGVLLCGLWCLAMIWVDRRFLPKPLQMGVGLLIMNWIAGLAMTGIGAYTIWVTYISK